MEVLHSRGKGGQPPGAIGRGAGFLASGLFSAGHSRLAVTQPRGGDAGSPALTWLMRARR